MNLILCAAYLLPFLFLVIFIGRIGTRFILFVVWGFIAAVPVYFLNRSCFRQPRLKSRLCLPPLPSPPLSRNFSRPCPS